MPRRPIKYDSEAGFNPRQARVSTKGYIPDLLSIRRQPIQHATPMLLHDHPRVGSPISSVTAAGHGGPTRKQGLIRKGTREHNWLYGHHEQAGSNPRRAGAIAQGSSPDLAVHIYFDVLMCATV